MDAPLLKVRELCKDFYYGAFRTRSIRVLDNINMEIHSGEIRGIVGQSGSGKTTLARCCLWLIKPSQGTVEFDGDNLALLDPNSLRAKRREFQMVFQDPSASLNPAMTVEEILREPFQVQGIGDRGYQDRRISELMQEVSLDESLRRRRPSQLSGGQQQRVGIARGLALQPRLLIADEPASALDVSVQAQILNLLADLKKRHGLTLILISHSLAVIHYLCSSISVMHQGRIVEEAAAAKFFAEPKHPYSMMLLNTMRISVAASSFSTDPGEADYGLRSGALSRCSFHEQCPRSMAVCKSQTPPLNEIHPGHKVACFLYL